MPMRKDSAQSLVCVRWTVWTNTCATGAQRRVRTLCILEVRLEATWRRVGLGMSPIWASRKERQHIAEGAMIQSCGKNINKKDL